MPSKGTTCFWFVLLGKILMVFLGVGGETVLAEVLLPRGLRGFRVVVGTAEVVVVVGGTANQGD